MSVDALARRIGPAAGSARASEQFPYRLRPGHEDEDREAIRREIGEFLTQSENLFFKIARSCTRNDQQHDVEGAIEEAVQDAMAWFVQQVHLFDQSRGTKLTTWLWAVTRNRMCYIMRRAAAQQPGLPLHTDMYAGAAPRENPYIERLAEAIRSNPRKFLLAAQARAVEAVLANPGMEIKAIAEQLGYKQASSLSMTLRRARERIVAIEPLDHDLQGEPDGDGAGPPGRRAA